MVHNWDILPELINGIFPTIECYTCYINQGSYPKGGANLDLGREVWHQSYGGEQLHCAWFGFFNTLLLFTIIIVFCIIFNYYFALISTYKFYFVSPPHSTRVWERAWASGWMYFISMGLNHDREKYFSQCHSSWNVSRLSILKARNPVSFQLMQGICLMSSVLADFSFLPLTMHYQVISHFLLNTFRYVWQWKQF